MNTSKENVDRTPGDSVAFQKRICGSTVDTVGSLRGNDSSVRGNQSTRHLEEEFWSMEPLEPNLDVQLVTRLLCERESHRIVRILLLVVPWDPSQHQNAGKRKDAINQQPRRTLRY